jgi:hypothetical protein
MRADKRSVGTIFDRTIRIVAPLFQRPYVWSEEKNWVPLWEAITDVAERQLGGGQTRPHFLGAIVLDQIRTPVGEIETRLVIDGQQRMTTLQVAMAAIRDVCRTAGAENYYQAWRKLTQNDIPLSDDPDELFKVWPTNVDREHFRRVMTAGSAEVIRAAYAAPDLASAAGHLVPNAYQFFYRKAAEWLGPSDGEDFLQRLRALHRAIRDEMHLVAIDLDPEDDAQLIFETLNALGAPLLPADLVKNFLFHAAHAEGQKVEQLYGQYWEPLDAEHAFWRQPVRQGRLNRPRIDLFLQHYLTLSTRQDIVATHLFAEFRDFAASRPDLSTTDHLQRIRTYSNIYKQFERFPHGTREGEFFYRLDHLDTTTVLPLLLDVFHQLGSGDSQDQLLQVLTDLESFLVRRAICNLSPKNYNRIFLDLLQQAADDGGMSAEGVRRFLMRGEAETNRWPDDEEFRNGWMSFPLFTMLVRKRLRMILEAVEEGLHTDFSEQLLVSRNLTIEHLMPRSWQAHWPLPDDVDPEEMTRVRERLIHTIGNLTLVTRKLNPSLSNSAWEKKQPAILQHGVLALNRKLQKYPLWDEGTIEARGALLFEVARRIWPHPGSGVALSPEARELSGSSAGFRLDHALSDQVERTRDGQPMAAQPMLEENSMKKRFIGRIRSEGEYADRTDRQYIAVDKQEALGFPFQENERVPIQLEIGGETYEAGVLTTPSQHIVYIAADLRSQEGEKVRLSEVLAESGFQRNARVTLEVDGRTVQVIPATDQ